jgi:prepilin-type N-terminal cleavage/methylation domain-containing protein
MIQHPTRNTTQQGFTVLEVLTTLGIAGIIMGTAAANLNSLGNSPANPANQLVGYVKQVRAKALSSTRAYVIAPISPTQIGASYADNCRSPTFTADGPLRITLTSNAILTDTSWSVCITSRGLTTSSMIVPISKGSETQQVEIALGGGVRKL